MRFLLCFLLICLCVQVQAEQGSDLAHFYGAMARDAALKAKYDHFRSLEKRQQDALLQDAEYAELSKRLAEAQAALANQF